MTLVYSFLTLTIVTKKLPSPPASMLGGCRFTFEFLGEFFQRYLSVRHIVQLVKR